MFITLVGKWLLLHLLENVIITVVGNFITLVRIITFLGNFVSLAGVITSKLFYYTCGSNMVTDSNDYYPK